MCTASQPLRSQPFLRCRGLSEAALLVHRASAMVLVGSPRDAVLERRTLREHQLRIARLQRSLTVVHDDEPAWDSGMRPSWPQTLRVCAWFVCFAAQEAKAVALAAAAPLLQVKVCAPRDSCSSRDSGAHTCTPRKQTREHTDPYTSCQKRVCLCLISGGGGKAEQHTPHNSIRPPPQKGVVKGAFSSAFGIGFWHWVSASGTADSEPGFVISDAM